MNPQVFEKRLGRERLADEIEGFRPRVIDLFRPVDHDLADSSLNRPQAEATNVEPIELSLGLRPRGGARNSNHLHPSPTTRRATLLDIAEQSLTH